MSKTIDISKIQLSAKGIAMLIVGLMLFAVIWKVAEWGLSKVTGGAENIGLPMKVV